MGYEYLPKPVSGPNIQDAYKYFIHALKQDSQFAPAFTSLGVYYLEHSSPPDHIRSSKCFQKAFELDARETVAARRLAEGFANDREWDLVEVGGSEDNRWRGRAYGRSEEVGIRSNEQVSSNKLMGMESGWSSEICEFQQNSVLHRN